MLDIKRYAFPTGYYIGVHSLVCCVSVKLPSSGRNDAGTRFLCRSFIDQPIGRLVSAVAWKAIPSPIQTTCGQKLANGRDLYQDQWRVKIPLSCRRQGRKNHRLLAESKAWQGCLSCASLNRPCRITASLRKWPWIRAVRHWSDHRRPESFNSDSSGQVSE